MESSRLRSDDQSYRVVELHIAAVDIRQCAGPAHNAQINDGSEKLEPRNRHGAHTFMDPSLDSNIEYVFLRYTRI